MNSIAYDAHFNKSDNSDEDPEMLEQHRKARYLPHEVTSRIHAVKLYRASGNHHNSVKFVCRRYHCSKASLMRWNKRYDGTPESLMDKSHRPHHTHPTSHSAKEIESIQKAVNKHPHAPVPFIWHELKKKGYERSCQSLRRQMRRMKLIPSKKLSGTSKYKPQKYFTPKRLGKKWQIDVKHVPRACIGEILPPETHLYQYTCIEEASRERFVFYYDGYGPMFTVDFMVRCFFYFGYLPDEIQTDNGTEFTDPNEMHRTHPVDKLLGEIHVRHHRIRPRTPRHNGKVERSHRKDNKDFYAYESFDSLADLRRKGKAFLAQYNNTPISSIGMLTPLEKRQQLMQKSKPHMRFLDDPMKEKLLKLRKDPYYLDRLKEKEAKRKKH